MALAAIVLGLWLAGHHPLVPGWALLAFVLWTIAACRYRALWLFVLPASLPVMNFSPWTGWIAAEAFDLVVLGAIAGGYARSVWQRGEDGARLPVRGRWVVAVLFALALASVWRGVNDAGGWTLGWFQGYTQASNSLRVGKSLLYALLLVPLLRRDAFDAPGGRRFGLGMLAGMAIVAVAAVWERAAYPGLFDFDDVYRTTALFWEMHVGGAAIDAYLALATPFVAWALWTARTRGQWLAVALFALVWGYVCLTTFARGVYLGVLTPLLLLGGLRLLGGAGWRRTASVLLALALVGEVAGVLGWGSFMAGRVSDTARDYQSRTAHWARGIALLHGPAEWVFGLGAGRLPAHYGREVPGAEFPGSVQWQDGSVTLHGPRSMPALAGLYGLTQRVPLREAYRIVFDVQLERPARVMLRVCESHLLYDGDCQWRRVRLRARDGGWQHLAVDLHGPPLGGGSWLGPRQGVLTVSVLDAGGVARFDNIVLLAVARAPARGQGPAPSSRPQSLLANGDFSAGLAHWLPAAQYYFIPWHIDNLALELLIEHGLVGLLAFAGLVAVAAVRLLRRRDWRGLTPFVAASLLGVLCVGLVSSVLDVPRVALLMWLALAWLVMAPARPVTPKPAGSLPPSPA